VSELQQQNVFGIVCTAGVLLRVWEVNKELVGPLISGSDYDDRHLYSSDVTSTVLTSALDVVNW
jgi:hypothetical protein